MHLMAVGFPFLYRVIKNQFRLLLIMSTWNLKESVWYLITTVIGQFSFRNISFNNKTSNSYKFQIKNINVLAQLTFHNICKNILFMFSKYFLIKNLSLFEILKYKNKLRILFKKFKVLLNKRVIYKIISSVPSLVSCNFHVNNFSCSIL